MFSLPPLPFATNALAPAISAETIEYHYGKHHQTYVDNLNKLTAGTDKEKKSLEELAIFLRATPIERVFRNLARSAQSFSPVTSP